jgi:hypothetical protein
VERAKVKKVKELKGKKVERFKGGRLGKKDLRHCILSRLPLPLYNL